jgi:hypothetical protein
MKLSIFQKAKKMKVTLKEETENARYYEVLSVSGNKYIVSIGKDGKFACDCQHFSLFPNKLCSHILAVIKKIFEEV